MEHKIIGVWLIILTAYGPWHVHAAVDCTATGSGRFIDPDDSTCTKFSLCLYLPGKCQYKAFDYTCPTYTIFDPALTVCTSATNFVCNSKCPGEGIFPDPDSTDCTSYLICVGDGKGFVNTVVKCPENTLFNPSTTVCEFDYICPKKVSCSSKGYFANKNDKTCQSYYYCSLLANGEYVRYDYKCPGIWKFSPIFRGCTPLYNCRN
ncbi:uncharacterized protein LOC113235149 [Hyposmocoma kahamanoa]|uniref:uncharacterized protein LOC113235149 n=1 Tax=Hyposmocoma kahamanoa TaxID=1477025 RepID=UPI000E6D84A8|nr:uncharacterized protein LOC113235149 [Hyposmocoma kahamanoa]